MSSSRLPSWHSSHGLHGVLCPSRYNWHWRLHCDVYNSPWFEIFIFCTGRYHVLSHREQLINLSPQFTIAQCPAVRWSQQNTKQKLWLDQQNKQKGWANLGLSFFINHFHSLYRFSWAKWAILFDCLTIIDFSLPAKGCPILFARKHMHHNTRPSRRYVTL